MMPGMRHGSPGKVRALDDTLLVIIITGYARWRRRRGNDAYDFIAKPFTPDRSVLS